MVGLTMTWLSEKKSKASFRTRTLFHHQKSFSHPAAANQNNPTTLGILAFEAAKAMSRLVALYTTLSDEEFVKLRKGPLKSRGVILLNSTNENFLLSLACLEKLEDLNQAAKTISRLGKKCANAELIEFDVTYESMKQGVLNSMEIEMKSKNVDKMINQMEKYISATANLHSWFGTLKEMEYSEKKIKNLKENGCLTNFQRMNLDVFEEKIAYHRKQVRHYKETSLWSHTFDKCVEMMSKITAVVFVKICVVFGPFVPTLPAISTVDPRARYQISSSPMRINPEPTCGFHEVKKQFIQRAKAGPISRIIRKHDLGPTRLNSPEMKTEEKGLGFRISSGSVSEIRNSANSVYNNTVGSAGLAVRYANVILIAERYFNYPTSINEEARGQLYEILPGNLKRTVRGKLKIRNRCRKLEDSKEVVEDIMMWLGPIAHDTIKWQQERNLEKQRFDAKPTVLLLHTLHFSDLEKTEAAIVEVLVGLSCINSYQNRRSCGDLQRMMI